MIAAFLAATAAFLEVGDDGCEDRRRGSRRPARRSRRTRCRRTSARCLGHKHCKRGAVFVQGSGLVQEKGVQSMRVEAGEEVAIVEVPQAHFEAALEELAVEGSQQGKEAAPGVAAEPRLEVQVLHVARSAVPAQQQEKVEEARRSSDAEECLGLGAAEVLMWAGIEDAAALCVQVHTCAAKGDFDSAKLLAVIDERIELLRAGTGRQALAALAWPCHKPRSCS